MCSDILGSLSLEDDDDEEVLCPDSTFPVLHAIDALIAESASDVFSCVHKERLPMPLLVLI
jgi:hypothetical protein